MVRGRSLRVAMLVLNVVGLGIASYLTYVHYSGASPICATGGCETVQKSAYSHLAGIPVALIGLLGYIAILASLLAPESERSRFATVGMTTVGFGFSAYLTGRELFSIHAICQWCVGSAIVMSLLVSLAVLRYLRGDFGAAGRAGDGAPQAVRQPSPPALPC